MLAEPAPIPVAKPVELTVATAVFDETHVTEPVKFCVVPSLNVPIAVNWSLLPFAIDAAAALTAIDCNRGPAVKFATTFDQPLTATVRLAGWKAIPVLEGVTV